VTKIKTAVLSGAIFVVAIVAVAIGAKWFFSAPSPELLKLYGGPEGIAVVQKAERVEAYLLDHDFRRGQEPTVKEGPVAISEPIASQLVSALSSHDSYGWSYAKGCIPVWGVRLSFYRGADRVDILLCFQCDLLQVSLNGNRTAGNEDFDPIQPQLAHAVKAIFPNDPNIQAVRD